MEFNTFWFDLTVSMLRMDPVGPLFAAMLRPAITSCVSLTALHAVQRGLLDVLTSTYATEFPPRPAYINSLLKLVVAACEERGREVERTAEADENEEGLEFVNEGLLELYLDSSCLQSPGESIDKNEANTFFSSLLTFPMGSSSSSQMASPAPTGLSFLSDAGTMGRFVPMRVTSAFVNVGLAVWPAAHVAIDLLSALVEGQPCAGLASHFAAAKGLYSALEGLQGLAQTDRLRVLELGAGVGLTPAVLHKRYQHATDRPTHLTIAVTDYQPNILDNCAFNLQKCGCPYAQFADSTSFAASSPLVPCGNADAIVVPLDWNERTETQRLIAAFRPSIAIAADCIYDRCVLEGLSLTLKEALLGGSCCLGIIIQTHRNDATQTELHNLLGAFAHVFSYWYDASERRLVPLEDSATGSPSASWHAGTKASVSQPR